MADLRRRFAEELGRDAAGLPPRVVAAFAAVPREAFVRDGFHRRDGTWAGPGSDDFLETVYRDDVLVTKVDGGVPVSSSSQPSLMGMMLAALRLRGGERVLEIGAGTGYNAALLRALGAEVTSVEVQEDVAARARAALARAGVPGVRVLTGDGYAGVPGERFDRVVVTVGVAGLSPHWLAQAGPGPIVAPVEHAGMHPVLSVTDQVARVVCSAGFMSAAGPLVARHRASHPPVVPSDLLRAGSLAGRRRWRPALDPASYRDLWFAAGAWSRRATHALLPGSSRFVAVLREGTDVAALLPDGTVSAAGDPALAAEAFAIMERWDEARRPTMTSWAATLAPCGDPAEEIRCPLAWSIAGS